MKTATTSFSTLFALAFALMLTACGNPNGAVQNASAPNEAAQVTNYFVRSTCNTRMKEAAIRMATDSRIGEAVDGRGRTYTAEAITLADFGMPKSGGPVGIEQAGSKNDKGGRRCVVRDTRSTEDSTQSTAGGEYFFAKPGALTTTQYDCFQDEAYQCSVTFEELPAGALTEVFSVAQPLQASAN